VGRGADLVNVAGKRASIGDLNTRLCRIDGVEDGVFFMPDEGQRMTAFVVAPGLNDADLLRALGRLIDPVFLPRPLFFVTSLPRNETGKLTRKALVDLYQALMEKR